MKNSNEIMSVQELIDMVGGRPLAHDSRHVKAGDVFIALRGELADGHAFLKQAIDAGAVAVIVDHDVDVSVPTFVVNDTLVAFQQLAKNYREQFDVKTIAVTGSCGKTTTRALLQSVFQQAGPTLASVGSYNNHFGVPLTLFQLDHTYEYFISEIGANHMGEIANLVPLVQPDVAIITNIGPAHLEGFGSLENTAKAKSEIYGGLVEGGVAIVNADDQFSDFLCSVNTQRRVVTFGIDHAADIMAAHVSLDVSGRPTFTLNLPGECCEVTLQLLGLHNVYNALAAAAAGFSLGLSVDQIKKGLEQAQSEQKRLNEYQILKNVTLIDDSYNANPLSTRAAIETLSHRSGQRILVLGDMLELGDEAVKMHGDVGTHAKAQGIDMLYCFGELSRYAAESFGTGAFHFQSREALIKSLRSQLTPGQIILVKGSNSMRMFDVVEALRQIETTV